MAPRASIIHSINRRRIMATRHLGAEKATASTLGHIFDIHPRTVHAEIARAVCAVCKQTLCHHSDAHYAGIIPPDAEA
ncbi:MAG TPA: hypothetical protein VF503_00150 [Sphingobium sp.]|uniref:hypothetical protein n=1 Tax=Sphingobium sp. TaxID=1912891 RepID=UPI002ED2BD00